MKRRPTTFRAAANYETFIVIAILMLAMIVSSACVLWFMSKAISNTKLAIRQEMTEFYDQLLGEACDKVADYWQEKNAKLRSIGGGSNEKTFHELVTSGASDSVIFFNSDFDIADSQPSTQSSDRAMLIAEEIKGCLQNGDQQRAILLLIENMNSSDLENLKDGEGRYILPNLELLALRLNNAVQSEKKQIREHLKKILLSYDFSMRSSQRVFLMQQFAGLDLQNKIEADTVFPTYNAEMLAMEIEPLLVNFKIKSPMQILDFSIAYGVVSSDLKCMFIFKKDRLCRELKKYLNDNVAHPNAEFVIYLPDGKSPVKSDFAYPFLTRKLKKIIPEWSIGVSLKSAGYFDSISERQKWGYLWIAGISLVTMVVLILFTAVRWLRQMKIARLKNDFVATVTHELKTPLASMRLLTDTLIEGHCRDETQKREYLELIARENQRLSRLIDNFLTFSRMERNKKVFNFCSIDPAEIVLIAKQSVLERFANDGFDLQVSIEPNLPKFVVDADAVSTVLINLLDNARKYSEDDKWIGLRVYSAESAIFFEVADHGIGLSKREINRIFDRFYQVDQHLSRKAEGCGLGLSIVKFIIDAHGGELNVTSEPKRGSRFSVKIPISKEQL